MKWRNTLAVGVTAAVTVAIFDGVGGVARAREDQTATGLTVRVGHVVDLTHDLNESTPFIPAPGTFPFKMTAIATLEKDGVSAYRWDIHEHIGTQIDAPSHFVTGAKALDAIDPRQLIVPLAVIDLRERARRDPDTAVGVADVLAWEKKHGRLPQGAAVFMWSGWDARIGDAGAFLNQDAHQTLHFPGFSAEAAEFLAAERGVSGLGVDTVSLDPGVDKAYRAHKAWLAKGKWCVELVANLAQVPPAGATVFVGAVKVKGATGGPVRLLAVW